MGCRFFYASITTRLGAEAAKRNCKKQNQQQKYPPAESSSGADIRY
jgi:hypothetical protein